MLQKFSIFFLLIFLLYESYAKNYSILNPVYTVRDSSVILNTHLTIKNEAKGELIIIAKKIYKDLPTGWYVCFCQPKCMKDTDDSIEIVMPFKSDTSIWMGFTPKGISGTGRVTLLIYQKNNPEFRDTVYLTAENTSKTAVSDIDETIAEERDYITHFEIFDINGRKCLESVLLPEIKYGSIYFATLKKGIYIVRLRNGKNRYRYLKVFKN